MQQQLEKVFFALIRFEINKTELSAEEKNLITPNILRALFNLSKKHDLAHIICDALEKNNLLPNGEEVAKRFLFERNMAIYRSVQQEHELEQIRKTLEEAKISFIPLKGSVIKRYYPKPYMRTSCDIDILVAKRDLEYAIKTLKNTLEYRIGEDQSSHDVSLFSPSGVHLELHHSLAEGFSDGKVNSILNSIWENVKDESTCKKTITNALFYFYHIAHMVKHFEIGGCGVRPFLDVYILKQTNEYNGEEVKALLSKANLLTFANAVEETAKVWFGGIDATELSKSITEFVLYSGMYADIGNKAVIQQVKKGGKFKYVLSRVFLSYEQLKEQYPKLENKKWLTLFYQVKRWFRLLFGKDSKNVMNEFKANSSVTQEKKEKIEKLLKELEL